MMRRMIRSSRIYVILIACTLSMSCSIMEEMNEDSAKAKAAIESEFGGEVQMGWHVENGIIKYVSVNFVRPPEGKVNLAQLKQRVSELVSESFRRNVQKVEMSIS